MRVYVCVRVCAAFKIFFFGQKVVLFIYFLFLYVLIYL